MIKFLIATFLFFCSGFFLAARDGNFYRTKFNYEKQNSSSEIPRDKNLHLVFYQGISFLKYHAQPGVLEITFPYSRLDTNTGGQIPEVFEYSKSGLTGNHGFSVPIVGFELKKGNCFFRADIRIPKKRRISEEHISFGYEYRINFSEKSHRYSALAGLNGVVPNWVSSVFIRGEIGIDFYKPVWTLGELPVKDTTIYMMGYTIKKSDSDVRKVEIFYEEDVLALLPSITLGLGTSQNRIDFSLTFSPFIPVLEKGGIRLLYKKNNTGWLNPYTWFWYPYKNVVVPGGQSGLKIKYDGTEVSKTPYNFGGMEIFLRIGFRIR